jgi:hypothetical protein
MLASLIMEGAWQKAEDTRILLQWLRQWLNDRLYADHPSGNDKLTELLDKLSSAVSMIDTLFSELYSHGYFIEDPEGRRLGKLGLDFLNTMAGVIRLCVDSGFTCFKQQPKSHSLHHTFVSMWNDCVSFGICVNPLSSSCQMLEDLIGRVCRLSRRVDGRKTALRTLQTVLIAAGIAWSKPYSYDM